MNKSLIINKIKEYYSFKNDSEFAKFLGITPQNLSNWKARNRIDYELLYTKCVEISADWMLSGKGEMLKKNTTPNKEKQIIEIVNDDLKIEKNEDFERKGFWESLATKEMLKEEYLQITNILVEREEEFLQIPQFKKFCDSLFLNNKIGELEKELQKMLREIKNQVKQK